MARTLFAVCRACNAAPSQPCPTLLLRRRLFSPPHSLTLTSLTLPSLPVRRRRPRRPTGRHHQRTRAARRALLQGQHAQAADLGFGLHVPRFQLQSSLQAGQGGAGLAQAARLLIQQSYMLAANDIFFAAGCTFLGLVPVIWLARPPGRPRPEAAAGH